MPEWRDAVSRGINLLVPRIRWKIARKAIATLATAGHPDDP
jgi:hypothetical protein